MEDHINTAMEGSSPHAPQKFSRYRSVRAKSASDPHSTPPLPINVEQSNDITRGPSRYRRNRAAPTVEAPPVPPPALQSPPRPGHATTPANTQGHANNVAEATADRARQAPDIQAHSRSNTADSYAHKQSSRYRRREERTNPSNSESARPPSASRTYESAREEARMILEGEFDRIQKMKRTQAHHQRNAGDAAPDLRRHPTTRNSLPAEAKHLEERKQTPPQVLKQASSPTRIEDDSKEKRSPRIKNIRQLITGSGGHAAPRLYKQEVDHSRNHSNAVELEKPNHVAAGSANVQANATSASPEAGRGFDAPISAVNAGDRRVEVKCNQASITLPVTPSTTVKDLLNSASVVMSEKIDPKKAVLVEAFAYLGLDRSLRRYEKIRDVMNSWDTDDQHYFAIFAEEDCSATGLDAEDAPMTKPTGLQIQMHHSASPGKWDKKWIFLREDGQVTVSKQESGKDSSNICHLSDFDIYTPTAKQKRILRSPKKICFAVKSQQKAAMFLEGQNFAHFFASNHKEDADLWYKALHSWRSWYLVNVLGEGPKKFPEARMFSFDNERRLGTAGSQDTVPYQLGSFRPLLDFSDIKFGADDSPRERAQPGRRSLDIHSGRSQRQPRPLGAPPTSFPQRLFGDAPEIGGPGDDENQPFTGTGLLARSASRRTQGGSGTGRGVAGAKGKPLVELSAESEFADGSLLRKLEALAVQNGEADAKVDREKRIEASARVGEGM